MDALRKRESRDDVHSWVRGFLAKAAAGRATPKPLSSEDFEAWVGPYMTRPKLALFLDYDGTLAPLVEDPPKAFMSDAMRAALERCAARDDTEVAIVSGRGLRDIQQMVGNPDLTYAGNHGLEISGHLIEEFRHQGLVHYQARTDALVEALSEVAVEGAWTEAKGPTLTYHYRKVPTKLWPGLVERARAIVAAAGFQARDAHAAIEARPPIGWDKGRAVLHILRERNGPGWSNETRVIYVGDDDTDEDAFRFLAGLAMTFRVGAADTLTAASRRLPNVEGVRALLDWIAARPTVRPDSADRPAGSG
jgi:trehalose-phosphatase